jgi:predicted nucleic acid-binding protein
MKKEWHAQKTIILRGEVILSAKNSDFLRVCQLCICRENKNFIKDSQDGLVISSMFMAENIGLSTDDILIEIGKKMGLKDFPLQTLTHIVTRLLRNGHIHKQHEKYFLEHKQSELIKKILSERKTTLIKVEKELVTRINKKTKENSNTSKLALNVLHEFLWTISSSGSKFVIDVFLLNKMPEYPKSSQDVLVNILEVIEDEKSCQVIQDSIIEMFKTQRTSFVKLLYDIAANYMSLEIIKVDPDGKKWKQSDLLGKTFILDTNVLFALILDNHLRHKVTNEITSIARDFKVNLMFTERTLQEWLEVLDKANQRFKFINSTRPSFLIKLEDIFIRSYFHEKEKNPSVEWLEYYSRMTQIGLLASNKNVSILNEETFSLSEQTSQELLGLLSNNVYQSGKKSLNNKFIKSKQVSEHDAYHLLLIRKLREKQPSEENGPLFWFLTQDVSLIDVDEELNKILGSPSAPPSTLIVDFIIPLALLFDNSHIQRNRLAEVFMSSIRNDLATAPNGLSASKIVEVLSPWLSYKSLSDEDLEMILRDEKVTELYNELREATSTDPIKTKDLSEKLRQKVEEKIWDILERKTHEAKNLEFVYS